MKNRFITLLKTFLILSSCILNYGCNESDESVDPFGTMVLTKSIILTKDAKEIGNIVYAKNSVVCYFYGYEKIQDVEGTIKYPEGIESNISYKKFENIRQLADIKNIPQEGFSEPVKTLAILMEKNSGYIVKFDDGSISPVYIRIFAKEDKSNNSITIKYQYPFKP